MKRRRITITVATLLIGLVVLYSALVFIGPIMNTGGRSGPVSITHPTFGYSEGTVVWISSPDGGYSEGDIVLYDSQPQTMDATEPTELAKVAAAPGDRVKVKGRAMEVNGYELSEDYIHSHGGSLKGKTSDFDFPEKTYLLTREKGDSRLIVSEDRIRAKVCFKLGWSPFGAWRPGYNED